MDKETRQRKTLGCWGVFLSRIRYARINNILDDEAISIFPMHSRSENGYRAAVAVESWMGDKLIIQGEVDGFPEFD